MDYVIPDRFDLDVTRGRQARLPYPAMDTEIGTPVFRLTDAARRLWLPYLTYRRLVHLSLESHAAVTAIEERGRRGRLWLG